MSEIQLTENEKSARSLLDELLENSKLYKSSKDYFALMKFVARMRNFAPFNAMLLQIQKPGLSYAASARDWWERFGRWPIENARPLLILWPLGPVALVYDVMDTDGKKPPEDVSCFISIGPVDDDRFNSIIRNIKPKNITWEWADQGDRKAGSIRVLHRSTHEKSPSFYQIIINKNHSATVKFSTMVHELGHLYLGHLGTDMKMKIPSRRDLSYQVRELEAESVAYLVCARNGVASKSETYLTNHVKKGMTVDNIDLYQIMRAAGQVEKLLGLTDHTGFDRPK